MVAAIINLSTPNQWPGCVAYFQQRKCFAASFAQPDTFWMTVTGNYKNFNSSMPPRDDDAITNTLASQQVNHIKALVPMNDGMLALTSGGAWQISGGSTGAAITPASITATAQAYTGCSDLPPLHINTNLLYTTFKGSIVRDLAYNFYVKVFTGSDRSSLSDHLFFGQVLTEWCWAEEPYRLVWAVRADGILLSLTYVIDQEVFAWARHDTQGLVESICTVSEADEDAVYIVVRRNIGGNWLRYIERFASRKMGADPANGMPANIENAWCVDAGLGLPRGVRPATLSVAAATGKGVAFLTDAPAFAPGDVGKVIRTGGGKAVVTAFATPFGVLCDIDPSWPILRTVPNDPLNRPVPRVAGQWTMTMPVTTVSGLAHLEGMSVSILADGNVMPAQVVRGGMVTLQQPASQVTVGLPYTCQLQTLRIEAGEPTMQGKRKKITAVTVRVKDARGLFVGNTFADLVEIKERTQAQTYGQPIPLGTSDERVNILPKWSTDGQVAIQITDPVPATILGVIPEITAGDT